MTREERLAQMRRQHDGWHSNGACEACFLGQWLDEVLVAVAAERAARDAEWRKVLDAYRYAHAFAAGDAWDGGSEVASRFSWAAEQDPEAMGLSNDDLARVAEAFHERRSAPDREPRPAR